MVAMAREKCLKNETKISGQGKVREFHFQWGEEGDIRKNEKSHGKKSEFIFFSK